MRLRFRDLGRSGAAWGCMAERETRRGPLSASRSISKSERGTGPSFPARCGGRENIGVKTSLYFPFASFHSLISREPRFGLIGELKYSQSGRRWALRGLISGLPMFNGMSRLGERGKGTGCTATCKVPQVGHTCDEEATSKPDLGVLFENPEIQTANRGGVF